MINLTKKNNKMKRIILVSLVILTANSFSQIPAYIPANGLMAWYPFSGNANDLGPNTHNGIVFGSVLTTDRFGAAASAYLYDGFNDYISVADNLNFRPQNFTISSWVTFNSIPNYYRLIIAKNVGSQSPESIDMNYAGSYNGWFCNIGTPFFNGPFLTPTYSIEIDRWYNLVYQFDDINDIQSIYVNGVFTASSVVTNSIGYDNQPWTFGMEYEGGTASFFFDGKIDDIGIWDRILTPTQILEVYNGATDLKTQLADNPFNVYPNPVNDVIKIKTLNSSLNNNEYNVTDVVGKTVLNGKLQSEITTISLDNLAAGIYFLQVGDKKEKVIKIIKQ